MIETVLAIEVEPVVDDVPEIVTDTLPPGRRKGEAQVSLRVFAWPEGRRGRRLSCLLCGRLFVSTGTNRRRCAPCNRRISSGILGDQEILLDRDGRVGPRERAD